ncbi:iron complex outermembrane receptor protein [Sphingobium sp. OAS761]|uniref:TonB-dependent receptor plug domain-containing protein n=1 Tax=Sphingobium sp. OAS761 TaxID=2817901 RepID=UPI00209E3B00|nr:TonB-dependent receptor [Sphingobium sp. OAS761]MCP1468409.1 iron complex outermembrane receptor protein [Sphingobium sp. OAS761]
MTRFSALKLSLILASSWSACAMAQEAPQEPQADEGTAIIVTGTRAVGISAAEAAAPVQVLSQEAISHVGQPNLNQVLTQIVPSFTAQTQGVDLSSFSLSARLRGLSPNHTLIMVNGKRRHGSAILQVISGPFNGSAAPSIDLIPPDAVERIEVLQEGAAAVYGTDAIAGVLNFILKDQDEGGTFKITGGQNYNSEGELFSVSGNVGFKLGEDGFLDLSLFHRRQDYTTVGTGQVQITRPDGSLQPNRPEQWANLAGDALAHINGGQPRTRLTLGFYNMGYDFGGVELYSFGDYSHRIGYAKQGYRHPKRICYEDGNASGGITPAAYDPSICYSDTGIYGMVPLQHVVEDEYSFTIGAKGEIGSSWNYDLSVSYGDDKIDIWTERSAHRELWRESYASFLAGTAAAPTTPSSAYDGGFRLGQTTINADIKKEFDFGMADPVTFAFGGEYRRDTYEIVAGDAVSTYLTGVQSFPGYKESDAGSFRRSAKAGYVNLILKPVEQWTVDLAGRYEDYTDFGDTTIGKITTRYDFSDAFAIRGTASTGFRAPTLAEQSYSSVNVGPTSAIAQIRPGTTAAALLGFSALRPEKSTNFSAGIVLRPVPKLAVTVDGYYIKIKDRIAGTAPRYAVRGGTPTADAAAIISALQAAGVVFDASLDNIGAQSFTNGIDTRTWGIDFSASYPVALDFGTLNLSLTANYNKTKITQNNIPDVFNNISETYIEDASPDYKVVANLLFKSGAFTLNARETFYGKTSITVTPSVSASALAAAGVPNQYDGVVGAAAITDLEASYAFTDAVTFSVGANNLFNKRPEVPDLLDPAVVVPAGTSPYVSGAGAYNSYYNHGPYGTSGGYYYARIDFKF